MKKIKVALAGLTLLMSFCCLSGVVKLRMDMADMSDRHDRYQRHLAAARQAAAAQDWQQAQAEAQAAIDTKFQPSAEATSIRVRSANELAYGAALSLLKAQHWKVALEKLGTIADKVRADHPDVDQRVEEARAGYRAELLGQVESARAAGDLRAINLAAAQLRQLGAAEQADQLVAEVAYGHGSKALQEGRLEEAISRFQSAGAFRDAPELLKQARERVADQQRREQEERERLARERAEEERLAREKAEKAEQQRREAEQTIAAMTSAIQTRPNDATPYLQRGRAKQAVGDRKGAALDFESYLQLSASPPENAAELRVFITEALGRPPALIRFEVEVIGFGTAEMTKVTNIRYEPPRLIYSVQIKRMSELTEAEKESMDLSLQMFWASESKAAIRHKAEFFDAQGNRLATLGRIVWSVDRSLAWKNSFPIGTPRLGTTEEISDAFEGAAGPDPDQVRRVVLTIHMTQAEK